ncbi:TIGR03943 family putative permease subunit [[Mycobacterium] fortunisiensis]|uniref:TIGR03943 family putative permease subunit n=1 Tax=[Mycobacterium] fortunisiensis TaxID=2600579 RepID=UPI001FE29620
MPPYFRARARLKIAAMVSYVRLLRLIVVVAEWWPVSWPNRPLKPAASVADVSTDVLRRPFPPLPEGRAPEISLPDMLIRVAQDSAGTLDNRTVTVSGFTMRDGDRTDLARVVIICCAADAQLARIHLSGPAAAQLAGYPENTWVRVEGTIPAGQSDSSRSTIPTMAAHNAVRTDPPERPYA